MRYIPYLYYIGYILYCQWLLQISSEIFLPQYPFRVSIRDSFRFLFREIHLVENENNKIGIVYRIWQHMPIVG